MIARRSSKISKSGEDKPATWNFEPKPTSSESESKAEIGLDKVVAVTPIRMINQVVTGLSENPDMGCKPVFYSTPEMPERSTLDVHLRC